MKQAIMTILGNIEIRYSKAPYKLASKEILPRINCLDVCNSNFRFLNTEHPSTSFPVVERHEYSATSAGVGDAVKSARVGLRVLSGKQKGMPNPHPYLGYFVCSIFIDSLG